MLTPFGISLLAFSWGFNCGLGVFLIIYPSGTGMITNLLLGWVLIVAGVAQLVFALQSQTVGNFFLKVLLGLLDGFCGIALAFFPISGLEALTLSVGILLREFSASLRNGQCPAGTGPHGPQPGRRIWLFSPQAMPERVLWPLDEDEYVRRRASVDVFGTGD